MRTKHLLPTVALLATAVAATFGLTGCSSNPVEGEHHWDDAADMRSSAEGDSVPTLVADDATDITQHTNQLASSGTQLRWKSTTGITRPDCTKAAIGSNTHPSAAWWPTEPPKRGWTCGWWHVFTQDGSYYAWHNSDTNSGN